MMGKQKKRRREEALRKIEESEKLENRIHPEECLLSSASYTLLWQKKLYIDDYPFFIPEHAAFPSGYIVLLPSNIAGNKLRDRQVYYGKYNEEDSEQTNTPSVYLWGNANFWTVSVWEYAPGPGAGDFEKKFLLEKEAVEYVVRYFFDADNVHFVEAKKAHEKRL